MIPRSEVVSRVPPTTKSSTPSRTGIASRLYGGFVRSCLSFFFHSNDAVSRRNLSRLVLARVRHLCMRPPLGVGCCDGVDCHRDAQFEDYHSCNYWQGSLSAFSCRSRDGGLEVIKMACKDPLPNRWSTFLGRSRGQNPCGYQVCIESCAADQR